MCITQLCVVAYAMADGWRLGKTLDHSSALLAASYMTTVLQSLRLCLKILSYAISLLMA